MKKEEELDWGVYRGHKTVQFVFLSFSLSSLFHFVYQLVARSLVLDGRSSSLKLKAVEIDP